MRLSKWHGLGNDYLLLEQEGELLELTPERVQTLCDYHFGVGSDGIIEVVEAGEEEVSIRIWNPDGSLAELSGSGTRIAARWLARRSDRENVRVRVGERVVKARMLGDFLVETAMGAVLVGRRETIEVDGQEVAFVPVSVGNPHAVVRHDPSSAELRHLGPLIERHKRFPERTNVQLVRVDGLHELTVGVWERGAGETLASGTSAVAAASAAIRAGWCSNPVTVRLFGGDLQVDLTPEGTATVVGPAQEICTVELSPELALP
ncbi:MAG: diaminopimelate epimerase [Gaiellaceae bacterium]